MSDDVRRILAMVSEGKITVDEGEKLISALGSGASDGKAPQGERPMPKFLKIDARSSGGDKEDSVRVRVPLGLIRAGMKMRGLVPERARGRINDRLREKGIDVDLFEMSEGDFDGFIRVLSEIEIEADDGDSDRVSVRLE